jgi:hypothetical protein
MDLRQHSTICKGCWQKLRLPVVLRGPLAIPFRVVGLRPSRMNPNTCAFCELAFTRIMKARTSLSMQRCFSRICGRTRTWLLDKDAALSRTVMRPGLILCRPVLGGLHHEYVRI